VSSNLTLSAIESLKSAIYCRLAQQAQIFGQIAGNLHGKGPGESLWLHKLPEMLVNSPNLNSADPFRSEWGSEKTTLKNHRSVSLQPSVDATPRREIGAQLAKKMNRERGLRKCRREIRDSMKRAPSVLAGIQVVLSRYHMAATIWFGANCGQKIREHSTNSSRASAAVQKHESRDPVCRLRRRIRTTLLNYRPAGQSVSTG
jgi:hypothetical protein